MTDLYLLRHGIAVDPGTPGIAESERPLTAKGEKRMSQIACGLRVLDLKLDRIVTSPLVRARSTAEIVARELALLDRLEIASVLQTGTSAATVRRWLRERSEERLLIVGHNPTLSDLVALLVLGSEHPPVCDLKKGGIAALTRSSASVDLYEIAWIATPRLLRRLDNVPED
ncbi:MAG: phosphohistidine phosphatase SixA [Isosphaeraceae bacterium]